jgi:4-azaleucine resistance transporter AzlC
MSSTRKIAATQAPPFTRAGVRAGATAIFPLIPSLAVYGVAFGIMAATAGLSTLEATLMSAWVYGGSAQMASLQVWSDPVPLAAVCLTTLAMNARYVLLGAALRPWLGASPAHHVYPSLFVMADGNWTLAVREHAQGRADAGFLLGSGIAMWLTWVLFTGVGQMFGQILGRPERFGLDFMLAAFFAAMAVDLFRSAKDMAPLVVGVVTAIVIERIVPGPWYIVAGALAGSAAGAVGHGYAD